MSHSYPQHLCKFLRERWETGSACWQPRMPIDVTPAEPLPDEETLHRLISVCYQSSLMREEERPIAFRLILRDPQLFDLEDGPPTGLHPLCFPEERDFDENELRRLSPASDFYRSMIGVRIDEDGLLKIWGLVHSGPRWVKVLHGGRDSAAPLPGCLLLCVSGPGRISAQRGSVTIGTLSRGRILCPTMDILEMELMPRTFREIAEAIWSQHEEARRAATKPWATLHPHFVRWLGQDALRRTLSSIRRGAHGGLILLVSGQDVPDPLETPWLSVKYPFQASPARSRYENLAVKIFNTLAAEWARAIQPGRYVGWNEFAYSSSMHLANLDEALEELCQMVAGLTAVDGAVLINMRFELLGFGAMISGELPEVPLIRKAHDGEARQYAVEQPDGAGSRHRSAYRFCKAAPHSAAIVISQDGNVRFIKTVDDHVTYWDQISTSLFEY